VNHTTGKVTAFIPRLRSNPSSEKRLLVLHPDGERVLADCSVGFHGSRGPIPYEEREANTLLFRGAGELLDFALAYIHWRNHAPVVTEASLAVLELQAKEAIKMATEY
jgi:hypothetical protein